MVHSEAHGHGLYNPNVDPGLRARVFTIGILLLLGFWGVAGFVVASLL
jgi:hypothetical protein